MKEKIEERLKMDIHEGQEDALSLWNIINGVERYLLPKDATTVFAKDYNPDEPRDAQGRWTCDGDPPQEDGSAVKPEPNRQAEAKDPPQAPQNPTEQVASGKTLDECISECWDLALPTKNGDAMEYRRCLDHCQGMTYWPQWAPYFPEGG